MGKRELTEAMRSITRQGLVDTVYIVDCTVNSYDKTTLTCDCTPIGGDATSALPGVLLMAENNDGLVVFPSVGSTVKVAFSTRTDPFVMQTSDIDEIQIYIPAGPNPGDKPVIFDMVQGVITFNDGSLGGMANVIELTTKFNNLEAAVNNLITAIAGWTPVPNDGGAALKVALATWLGQSLTPTVQTDIENLTILNGK